MILANSEYNRLKVISIIPTFHRCPASGYFWPLLTTILLKDAYISCTKYVSVGQNVNCSVHELAYKKCKIYGRTPCSSLLRVVIVVHNGKDTGSYIIFENTVLPVPGAVSNPDTYGLVLVEENICTTS